MKKLLLIAALVLSGALTTFAQDAKTVMDRYLKETNLNSVAGKEMSSLTEMTIASSQGGMSMEIKAKAIMQQPGNKMRMEMNMMGMDVLMVVNGNKGWMKQGEQVVALPKDQLDQMSSQGNAFSSVMWDESKYTIEYAGEEGDYYVLKITPKDPKAQVQGMRGKFSKKTGLIERMDMDMQGVVDAETVFSEYKKFGDVLMPTVMKTLMSGEVVATITITNMQMGYPTAEYMFAEPK